MENRIFRPSVKGNTFALLLVLFQVIGGKFLFQKALVPFIVKMGGGVGTILVVSQLVLLILPVIIYFLITRQSIKETLSLNKPYLSEILFCILIGVLAQFVAMFCTTLSSFVFKSNEVEQVFKLLKGNSYLSLVSIIAFTPAICEEIVMRGVVLSNYKNKNIWKACIMSGVIFGMLHLTGSQFLYASLLGILLAYLVRITKSIFTSMTVHFVFNGFSVTLGYLSSKLEFLSKIAEEAAKKQETITLTQRLQGLASIFVVAVIASSVIIIILQSIKKKREALNGTITNTEVGCMDRNLERDNMINAPFIILVAFYLFYMWNNYF